MSAPLEANQIGTSTGVSLRFGHTAAKRVQHMSKQADMNKSEFCRDLIEAGMVILESNRSLTDMPLQLRRIKQRMSDRPEAVQPPSATPGVASPEQLDAIEKRIIQRLLTSAGK